MEDILKYKMNKVLTSLKLNAKCVHAEQNRHLAFFDLQLDNSTRVRKIEMFNREISLGLKSKTQPIIQTLSDKGVVRVKVAMGDSKVLPLDHLLSKNVMPSGILPTLLGETDTGTPLWMDMSKNPHLLIAGTTGSGKSTLLHVIIENLINRDDTFLYLIDPKQGVEFGLYEKYKNTKVICEYNDVLKNLQDLKNLMEKRFLKLKQLGLKSIEENPFVFNKYIVIIDEVSDIMLNDSSRKNPNKNMFETLLVALAQKARAAGIYLVCATQRPSVDVLTGLIKANFPARISCKVNSAVDSKVILDSVGAESLLGRGDAILSNVTNGNIRFQSAFVKR
jgi:S-DNA-T family DNA segregation ATPase FtsK/SpoIIIE